MHYAIALESLGDIQALNIYCVDFEYIALD